MEDILDIYEKPYNPQISVDCMDEKLFQLLNDTRESLPAVSGNNQKIDYEYKWNGTCRVYLFLSNPLVGNAMPVFVNTEL